MTDPTPTYNPELPYPGPKDHASGLIPPERLREDDLPLIDHPRVPHNQLPHFTAAIRIALREHYVKRAIMLDFTHEDVKEFSDSVLANWSAALTQS